MKAQQLFGALAAAAIIATEGAAAAQDAAKGEQVFRRLCTVCHAVGEDARNKVGPVLNGIMGRKAGTVPGYSYSDANRNADVVWTAATLPPYLRDPRAAMPGTKMLYAGMRNDAEIADLIAYLEGLEGG